MSITKRFKQKWTSVPNHIINSADISMKAKTLWAYIASKKDDWEFSINGTAAQMKEGRDSIRSAIKELEQVKLLSRIQQTGAKGRFGTSSYIISDYPLTDLTDDAFSDSEESPTSNTNLSNTNLSNTIETKSKPKGFKKPSLSELQEYCYKENLIYVDADVFIDFYEANGWMAGKNKMKDWQATARNWQRRHKADPARKSFQQIAVEENATQGYDGPDMSAEAAEVRRKQSLTPEHQALRDML